MMNEVYYRYSEPVYRCVTALVHTKCEMVESFLHRVYKDALLSVEEDVTVTIRTWNGN